MRRRGVEEEEAVDQIHEPPLHASMHRLRFTTVAPPPWVDCTGVIRALISCCRCIPVVSARLGGSPFSCDRNCQDRGCRGGRHVRLGCNRGASTLGRAWRERPPSESELLRCFAGRGALCKEEEGGTGMDCAGVGGGGEEVAGARKSRILRCPGSGSSARDPFPRPRLVAWLRREEGMCSSANVFCPLPAPLPMHCWSNSPWVMIRAFSASC